MITITRLLAHRLRTVFSRALGRSASAASVQFRSNDDGLSVSVRGAEIVVEHRIPGRRPVESFAGPLSLLKRCEGSKDDPVTLESRSRDVEVRWSNSGVPQCVSFGMTEPFDLPPIPEQMAANEPRLMSALRDAADSTDAQSTRYALACVQLRARDGRIAATDSRQLLVETGFAFPWDGEALVPGHPVFACRDLHGEQAEIGKTNDWVTLRTGPWTIHLRIVQDGRFPQVESIIPRAENASSVLRLDPADGEFLVERLSRLPASAESDRPVTVDLNGHVAIRSKGESDAQATELRLTNSRLEGRPMLVQTNREFLSRAVKLGFREVCLYDPRSTVLCRDEHRSYVWMLLDPASAVAAEPEPVRIESPVASGANRSSNAAPVNRIKRRLRQVPEVSADAASNGTSHREKPVPISHSAVDPLVVLRDTLKSAVRQTNEAIRGLKRQKREHRLLKSTLASLRQLQGIAS